MQVTAGAVAVQVKPLGEEVTVYVSTAPLEAVHETAAEAPDKTALTPVGATGRSFGTEVDTNDAVPSRELNARMRTEYVVPFVNRVVPSVDNFVISIGDAVVPLSVRSRHETPLSVEY